MMNIDFEVSGDLVQFVITGHAKYADPGQDIVCAGISALTNTLMNIVGNLGENGLIRNYLAEDTGEMVHILIQTGGNAVIETVIDNFYIAYCEIAEQYPQNVTVNIHI